MNAAEYIRAVERHVCQKNDGHLIRIVGPAFEIVARWERDGVPLKVALRGIDRYFERYYRKGPQRRPVRVEFCDTDVLEVFDEWRRAVGVTSGALAQGSADPRHDAADGEGKGGGAAAPRGPSLPAHLERVLTRLSSARATGRLGPDADALIDRVSTELDQARAHARGIRGDDRRALLERLAAVDRALLDAASLGMTAPEREALAAEAAGELAAFRDRLAPEAFAAAVARTSDRLIRERTGLPVVAFG